MFFKKVAFLKTELHLFLPILPSGTSDAAQFGCYLSGEIVTSQAVLDNWFIRENMHHSDAMST